VALASASISWPLGSPSGGLIDGRHAIAILASRSAVVWRPSLIEQAAA